MATVNNAPYQDSNPNKPAAAAPAVMLPKQTVPSAKIDDTKSVLKSSMEPVHQIYEIECRKYMSPLAICVVDVPDIQRFSATDHLPHGSLDSLLSGPVTVVIR